jgi:hypothetical protein
MTKPKSKKPKRKYTKHKKVYKNLCLGNGCKDKPDKERYFTTDSKFKRLCPSCSGVNSKIVDINGL